jgi:hypothetical protein
MDEGGSVRLPQAQVNQKYTTAAFPAFHKAVVPCMIAGHTDYIDFAGGREEMMRYD